MDPRTHTDSSPAGTVRPAPLTHGGEDAGGRFRLASIANAVRCRPFRSSIVMVAGAVVVFAACLAGVGANAGDPIDPHFAGACSDPMVDSATLVFKDPNTAGTERMIELAKNEDEQGRIQCSQLQLKRVQADAANAPSARSPSRFVEPDCGNDPCQATPSKRPVSWTHPLTGEEVLKCVRCTRRTN